MVKEFRDAEDKKGAMLISCDDNCTDGLRNNEPSSMGLGKDDRGK